MESVSIILPSSGKSIAVKIDRKHVKTCRLKVYPDQSVQFSVPESIPTEWVINYLGQKVEWIERNVDLFTATKGYASTNEIKNGFSIKMFGEDLLFSVSESSKNYIYREGRNICIGNKNINDQAGLMKQFEAWWREESLAFLEERVNEFYPIIKKYGKPLPKIQLRKMRTLWGSCNVNRAVVTFNQYLIKAKPACIDYVVLHELVHFIYPNHSRQFYDFLSIHMPDWKARKKVLDQDVVHGL
jgi:hypothetical protein